VAATTVYAIPKPTVAGDSGVWGGFLNTGMDTIDNEIARSRIPFVSPTYNVGGTTTCDLNQTTGARVFVFTVSGASTLAFSNVPSASFDCRVSLIIVNGSAFVLTFPASVTWLSGIAPTFKASGTDIVDLETKDGGTTWFATLRNLRPGVIKQFQQLTTTSGADASLASYVLPAGTLATNGHALRIIVAGTGPAGGATVNIKFGAGFVANFAVAANDTFFLTAILTRTGATAQFTNWFATKVLTGNLVANSGVLAETLANAITLDIRGNVTTGGQTLTYNTVQIELLVAS